MNKILFQFVFAVFWLFAPMAAFGQEVSVTAGGYQGVLIKKDIYMKQLIKTQDVKYFEAAFNWKAKGDSVDCFDEIWGCPTLEGGLLVGDYSRVKLHWDDRIWSDDIQYTSGLGVMITPFFAFRRSLARNRNFDLGYKFENGLGFCTRPYNTETNAENNIIGNWLSVFVGLGVYAKYNVTRNFQLGIEAGFRHYSNGKLNQPNIGANTLDVGLTASYVMNPDTVARKPYVHGLSKDWKKHLYADFTVGIAPQTLLQDFNYDFTLMPADRQTSYKMYYAWSASGALMWSYSRKFSSGVGFDYVYMPFTSAMAESEARNGSVADYKLSPHVLGVSLQHEAFYKDFSLHMSIGYYLQKRLGCTADANQKRYYETVGLRWYMPVLAKRMYLGYNINACAIKANYFQFVVGYCPFK